MDDIISCTWCSKSINREPTLLRGVTVPLALSQGPHGGVAAAATCDQGRQMRSTSTVAMITMASAMISSVKTG
jgi:hypothetical protein